MDSNNWRQPSPTEQPPMDSANGDWRSKLRPRDRQSVVNNIMNTLRHHSSSSDPEGVQQLMKLAARFEQNVYHAATSQSDYVRRISSRLRTLESISDPPGPNANAMPLNTAGMSSNSQDPASQSMQSQMQKQGQALPIQMASNQPTAQGRPQLLTSNIQSNVIHARAQSSATALQPHTQQQIQQNNLLPSAQLQSSQRSVMQNSSQSSLPSTHQQQFNSQTLVVGTHPQQEKMLGSQSASLDAIAHSGNSDTQEEVYQKIKVLKDMYFADVLDIYRKICLKLQRQAIPEASATLKSSKQSIEHILQCLQIPQNSAQHIRKDRLAIIEKQILNVLELYRSKKPGPPLQQGQIPLSHMQSLQQSQHSHSQIPQNQPLERLLKVVKSMSSKALNSAVGCIISVVIMIDQIAGSAPGNGFRAALGEDLLATTKCHLQARNFITQDSSGMKRMRCYTSAMPLNVASSVGSPNNSFNQLTGSQTSELESTATSSVKRRRIEINPAILEEIKDVNEHLIATVVDLSNENVDPTLSAVALEGSEGTIVKCNLSTIFLCHNLKAQMSPIQPLRLLIPADYPNCSPILLDKFPVDVSNEYDDLSVKVKSRFSISLRALSQLMSIREIARTWDDCVRSVITEYAQLRGGGTFSSKYGTWENCLIAN